jgi:hypothetical protein
MSATQNDLIRLEAEVRQLRNLTLRMSDLAQAKLEVSIRGIASGNSLGASLVLADLLLRFKQLTEDLKAI